jgi:soluble lytic murein transglycosylase-like protein
LHRTLTVAIASFALCALSAPARAELVFFASGRTMSVKGHRIEGSSVVLLPRKGGEIVLDASFIARITPDEVPYVEPQEADTQTPSSQPVARQLPVRHPEYDPIIEQVSAEQGVDATLVRAMIQVESNYQRRARSRKGAMGLMQLMPETARRYAVADPYDPVANIRGGTRHLKSLLERFPLALALAAYNAGEATVQRFRDIPPYPETRSYVRQILQLVGR